MKQLVDVLRAGILWGLIFAYLYAVWVLGRHVLHGPDALEPHGAALLRDIGAYAVGGLLTGMVVRLLQLLRSGNQSGRPDG